MTVLNFYSWARKQIFFLEGQLHFQLLWKLHTDKNVGSVLRKQIVFEHQVESLDQLPEENVQDESSFFFANTSNKLKWALFSRQSDPFPPSGASQIKGTNHATEHPIKNGQSTWPCPCRQLKTLTVLPRQAKMTKMNRTSLVKRSQDHLRDHDWPYVPHCLSSSCNTLSIIRLRSLCQFHL